MTPELWHRVKEVFDAALERDSNQRAAFLDEACDGDVALRREVESLIESYEKEKGFMSMPVIAAGPSLFVGQAESLVGQMVGHYRILAPIGVGGMGEVYLAQDTRLGRQVAVKLLPTYLSGDNDRLRRFEQEARAASSLNHPNVCMIHEVGEMADGRHYIVMEHIEGVTLRESLAIKPLKLREVLDVAVQVASALEAAHAAGVVHRDIKPENIMLRRDGYIKVLDFGLAKLTEKLSERQSIEPEAPTRGMVKTDVGVVMGTVAYMSPEQTRGLDIDARADIWSLGVVLYEMVTGRVPFEGTTNSDLIVSILEREPKPLTWLLPKAPAELQRIIAKSLRKDREERYQGIKDLLLDLKSLKREMEFESKLEHSVQRELHDEATAKRGGQSAVENPDEPAARTSPLPATRPTLSAKYLVSAIKRRKLGALLSLATLVLAAAGSAYIAYLIYQRPKINERPTQYSLARLTFDPGLQTEPSWSPDGRFIAYTSDRSGNFDIWVQPVVGGDAVQVTRSAANDWQPDWSPAGSQIVFRSERDGGGLYTVPVLGGHEQKISSFGYRPRWSPDGSQILFTNMWQGVGLLNFKTKLYVVRPGGGEPREVLADFMRGPSGVYSFAWHSDGQRITILRGDGFWTMPLQGAPPVKSEITGDVSAGGEFRWAPAGDALYFQGISQEVKNLWKVAVDPQSLRLRGKPERLTTGAGPDTDIALSPDGKSLAFVTRVEDVRVWSLPFDARAGKLAGEGQPVTAAGIIPSSLDLTRDGQKLVFIALRTGTQKKELWEKSLADGRERLLTVREYPFFSPRWSRDGTRLAYQLPTWILSDPRVDPATVILPVGGGDEQKLTSGKGGDGLPFDWSADGQWVLAGSDLGKPGQSALVLLPVSAAPHAEAEARVVVSDSERMLFEGRFSPDDRWLCFNAVGRGSSTLFVVAASGGKWVRITEENGWADKPRWSPDGRAIYFVSRRGTGFLNVWAVKFDPLKGEPLGEPFQVTTYQSPAKGIWPEISLMGMSLSADRLVLPISEVTGSIWMLENVDR